MARVLGGLGSVVVLAVGCDAMCNTTKYWQWYNSDYVEETENTMYQITGKVDVQADRVPSSAPCAPTSASTRTSCTSRR